MERFLKGFMKEFFLFGVGGILYNYIELAWRGYTHWSMFLCGGLCFVLIGLINNLFSYEMEMWKQMFISSVYVTILELIFGIIFNINLGMNVWDYSDLPFNLFGQICLPFMIAWFLLSAVAIVADDYIRYWLFAEDKPKYKWL